MLTKEQILAAEDRRSVNVNVPEWGGEVRLMTMTGTDRDSYEQLLFSRRDKSGKIENIRATLVSFCIVDEDGNRMFSTDEVDALGKKASFALDRLFEVAQTLNRMDDASLEDAQKN